MENCRRIRTVRILRCGENLEEEREGGGGGGGGKESETRKMCSRENQDKKTKKGETQCRQDVA